MRPGRIFAVHCPKERIVVDIIADTTQRCVVADDMFVIVALPNGLAGCAAKLVYPFGCC